MSNLANLCHIVIVHIIISILLQLTWCLDHKQSSLIHFSAFGNFFPAMLVWLRFHSSNFFSTIVHPAFVNLLCPFRPVGVH